MPVDPLDRVPLEEVGAVFPQRVEATVDLLEKEEQVDARGRNLRLDLLRRDAGKTGAPARRD